VAGPGELKEPGRVAKTQAKRALPQQKAQGNALTLNTLRFVSEIRALDKLRLPVNEKLAPNEVNLAVKLVEGMTVKFNAVKYHDTYSEDVLPMLQERHAALARRHRQSQRRGIRDARAQVSRPERCDACWKSLANLLARSIARTIRNGKSKNTA
jgi:non-homologous end joining protein Ku